MGRRAGGQLAMPFSGVGCVLGEAEAGILGITSEAIKIDPENQTGCTTSRGGLRWSISLPGQSERRKA